MSRLYQNPMPQTLTILLAQLNPTVGAIETNAAKIISIIRTQQEQHDVILFPELVITGYPPEDLLFGKRCISELNKPYILFRQIPETVTSLLAIPVWKKESALMQQVFLSR